MTYAITAIALALIALLYFEKKTHKEEITSILFRADAERQVLLNRIQAPETAVAQTVQPTPGAKHVPFDDDDAYARMTSGEHSK